VKTIILKTKINAPVERCFDLARSIDLHQISTSKTKEQAIDGVVKGFIELNQTVTWKAKHFGFWHKLKVTITEFEKPNLFVDEMQTGIFKFMKHKHEFVQIKKGTLMIDTFEFSSPLGIIGKIVDSLILEQYMTKFLKERNNTIKIFAESNQWKQLY